MKDLYRLLDAIHMPLCRPEYCPMHGETHCNQYVAEVCEYYGYLGLKDLMANQIIDLVSAGANWSEVPMEKCQDLANQGTLVVAGLKGDPHGHVNIICPGKVKTSGRWGIVPSCANVGRDIFIGKGINWSFTSMPRFYAWRPSL